MQKFEQAKYVSVPSLAPLDEFTRILKSAWDSRVLTHNGPLVQLLEKNVNAFLNTKNAVAVTNGTIALQLAIRALDLKGEIITTPFTWIATASAIKWENCTPVFVDIDEDTFNIDPDKIEAAITPQTSAIMPVHVFSNPVDIAKIEEIAKKHQLKVIYDAAHAFGVNYRGKPVMEYGDISCTSFHATKIFNSGEGGACFTQDDELFERLKRIRFFGHDDNKEIIEDGINGKLTEVHAAIGLANLPLLSAVIEKRKSIYHLYFDKLKNLEGIRFQKFNPDEYNYSYLPVVFPSERICLDIMNKLSTFNAFPRRYFYPSLNTIKAVGDYIRMPVSEDISKRILCLPSNNDLILQDVEQIADIILKYFH
jgi:dTDP-4-amino-4,6-dideoxygalactose transaminase